MKKLRNGVMLLATMFALLSVALAADLPTITLDYPEDTSVGEVFTLEIILTDNPGISALQMTLGFDQTVLSCTGVEPGAVMTAMSTAVNPTANTGAILVGATANEVTEDGTLGVFTFEVLAQGSYGFTLNDVLLANVEGNDYGFALDLGAQGATEDTTASQVVETTIPDDPTGETVYRTLFEDTVEHWAAQAIDQVAELGLMQGYGESYFGPDDNITRGQLVTILWRNAGSPEPSAPATFADLDPEDTYYHDAVAWAEETGVIKGYANGNFGPNDAITREQMAAILYRMEGETLGMAQLYTTVYDVVFQDAQAISPSLVDGVYWAVYHDIWCDTDAVSVGTTLSPEAYATRGQIAVMLCGYLEYQKGAS